MHITDTDLILTDHQQINKFTQNVFKSTKFRIE